ncbi:MAG: type II secretion system minor pseudopilin GspJ [Gammaproteobacteria bacterium]
MRAAGTSKCGSSIRGFTLIELLVAIAIFGVISMLALGGLNTIVQQQTLAKEQMVRLGQLQRAVRMITWDFTQLNPRFVRDLLGRSTEAPLVTDGLDGNIVRLSRGGWRNPVPAPRGTLQRVQYRIEDEKLIREYWPVMDFPLGMEPRSEEILEGVVDVEIEYLDNASQWSTQWPPLSEINATSFVFPRAVRIRFELDSWGEIERVVDLL